MNLFAYTDRPTVRPGEAVELYVSTTASSYDAQLLRVRGSDGPVADGVLPLRTDVVRCQGEGTYEGRVQTVHSGSFAISSFRLGDRTSGFELELWASPTMPDADRAQCLLALESNGREALSLLISDGTVQLELGGVMTACVKEGVTAGWIAIGVALEFDHGTATVSAGDHMHTVSLDPKRRDDIAAALFGPTLTMTLAGRPANQGNDCAARPWPRDLFNGKLESPKFWVSDPGQPTPSLAAAWDFTDWTTLDRIPPLAGSGLPGQPSPERAVEPLELFNLPLRACTGRSWDGTVLDWRVDPEQYAAVHFHDDDVADAGWISDATFTLPNSLPSGVYALHVATSDGDDTTAPIFVPRNPQVEPSRVVFLASTFSYLAYSNKAMQSSDPDAIGRADAGPLNRVSGYISDTPEFGWSTYNRHRDGCGISHVSWSRPKPDIHPDVPNWLIGDGWNLSADMRLLAWLDDQGVAYDVITDDLVDEQGLQSLDGYDVLLTSTHPEYVTARELDALEQYVADGGNLMYLGGNGFYWVISRLPGSCSFEMRRGQSGTRGWESECGEAHQFTGEPGGLWRHRGRAPQKLFGVGFASQGFGSAAHYDVLPVPPEAAFVLDGVESSVIGKGGGTLGGAAGEEIDRIDYRLGTPASTIVIATSEGNHAADYLRVIEDCLFATPKMSGPTDPLVRADVVLIPGDEQRGCVFSTGSISWCSVLPSDDDVSRITKNVIDEFLRRSSSRRSARSTVLSSALSQSS